MQTFRHEKQSHFGPGRIIDPAGVTILQHKLQVLLPTGPDE